MPKRYSQLHAMGVRPGLMHAKRHLAHFFHSSHVAHVHPSMHLKSHAHLKHLQITEGSGAQRRLTHEEYREIEGEGMHHKHHHKSHRTVNPISFKF